MKQDLIIGSNFAFAPGSVHGVIKEQYKDYEESIEVVKYELIVVMYENRQHINYDSEAERDADYEIILQSL